MAVRLDEEAVRDAVGPEVFHDAEKLLASESLGEVTEVGGGVAAVVHSGHDVRCEVWVGVAGGVLIAECDCATAEAGAGPEELCAHAVAVTLAALREGFAWSSSATQPSTAAVDPGVDRLAEIAATLPPGRLAMLVAELAVTDRRLRARLMNDAGMVGPLTEAELTTLRRAIDSMAQEATAGRWDLHDVAKAGEAIIEELEVLVQRPPSEGALLFVEHAAAVWDGLAGYLFDAWETFEGVPEELGDRVRAVHLRLCAELRPDPDELTERLVEIVGLADFTSCLHAPDDYLPVLGPDRVAVLRHRHR